MIHRILLAALLSATFLVAPAPAQQSGFPARPSGLTAETWTGLTPGKSVLILRKEGISSRVPNTTQIVPNAAVTGLPLNSGTRLRGTLTPMVDDTYTFWVNGADNVALWLSEDGTRFTKRLVAWHLGSTTTTEWSKHRDQKSVPVALTAGVTYHIEAHVMSGAANGHVSIAWQGRKGNWALAANGATATQSTTQWSLGAGNAIDGNSNGVWNQGTMTTNVQNSWLKVDFAGVRPLNRIVLFNNTNDQLRLSNFRLSALDASGAVLAQQDFFTTSGNVGNSFTWDMPAVVQAASVKIQLLGNNRAGNGYLALAEIQAYNVTPPPANWALATNGSTATQSTTSGAAAAARAIDGNTNGDFAQNSVTLTNDEPGSWLEIDLGQDRPVNRLVLHNRNTLQSRLSNFRLSLLDASNAVLATRDHFTTAGNAGTVLHWNLLTSVQARRVRVELLGTNLDGNGHLSLAEIQAYNIDPLLETRDFQVIPSAYLGAITPEPADLNDNFLPDLFEQQTGLTTSSLPGALLEHGDPDKDGIPNHEEYTLGSNPLAPEDSADVITREMWMDHTSGSTIASFVQDRQRFLGYPNEVAIIAGIDASPGYKNYGARYRGSFVAPSTGTYRFWTASNNSELWLSDGTITDPATSQPLYNRFGKQRVATSYGVVPVRDFDFSSSQRSRAVSLVQGQRYHIEVMHKQAQAAVDHVSVAWQPPGQTRALMPAGVFIASAPEPGDIDDDTLPDSWESTVGLNPSNNGRTSAADGEYADPDADGLTNLEEYQNGSNPFSADTDGDGFTDADEVRLYRSNPAVSNSITPVTVTQPPLQQYSSATGHWTTETGGTMRALDRRGAITYTFTVAQPGVHEITLSAGVQVPSPWYTTYFPVELSVNGGAPLARATLSSRYGNPDTLRALTPWLPAGNHTVTVFHDNYNASVRLRVHSLTLKLLGGSDLDEDGIPDWLQSTQTAANALTRVPAQSRTSPASIEGVTQNLTTTGLTVAFPLPLGEGQGEGPQVVTANSSINTSFFADVPLSANGPVTLDAAFLGGSVTETRAITWIPTNVFGTYADNTLHIRQGDSLRLDAWSGPSADGQPFTVSLNGTLLADVGANTSHTSGQPFAATFSTPGNHTLVASHGGQQATITLQVHAADFGPAHVIKVGSPRPWTPPVLGPTAVVEADERIVFQQTSTTGPRVFQVAVDQAVTRHVIARLPEGIDGAPSAILARGSVHAFDIANVDRTKDAALLGEYPDGTSLMAVSFVGVNLPPNLRIRIDAKNQGTIFLDGNTSLWLDASDFNVNGIANVYFEWIGTGAPKLCHTVNLFLQP